MTGGTGTGNRSRWIAPLLAVTCLVLVGLGAASGGLLREKGKSPTTPFVVQGAIPLGTITTQPPRPARPPRQVTSPTTLLTPPTTVSVSSTAAPTTTAAPVTTAVPSGPSSQPAPDSGWVTALLSVVMLMVVVAGSAAGVARAVTGNWTFGLGARGSAAAKRARAPQLQRSDGLDVAFDDEQVRELLDEVQASIDALEASRDAREGVIARWLRLQQSAGRFGIEPRPTDTATDLVTRLLDAARLPRDSVGDLATRYLRARYSRHPVTDDDRGLARRDLDEVASALADAARARADSAVPVGAGTGGHGGTAG